MQHFLFNLPVLPSYVFGLNTKNHFSKLEEGKADYQYHRDFGSTTTHLLTGVGQFQNNAWVYYHGDALGSVRHVTDESGDAIGAMRYSPFGERVESTGLLPFMGFTGEPQDPSSDLTYLRARYYNPDLGRFITADSIIPDPTNGQAWNSYTYVYNDVTNWTDPSGFDRNWVDGLHNSVVGFSENVGNWWNSTGNECECRNTDNDSVTDLRFTAEGYWIKQAWWAQTTSPALLSGSATIQKLTLIKTPIVLSILGLKIPTPWKKWGLEWVNSGYSTNISNTLKPWNLRNLFRFGGWDQHWNGTYRIGLRTRAIIENANFKFTSGPKGFLSSAAGAGVIDGVFQGINDFFFEPCLTNGQRVGRILIATAFGVGAGLVGASAYGALIYMGASASFALPASFVASAGAGYWLNEPKEDWFTFLGLQSTYP